MAKKKRLSENAVDSLPWIRKTTENAEEPKPAKKTKATPRKANTATEATTVAKIKSAGRSTPKRVISVEFNRNDGAIISTHEMVCDAEEITSEHVTSASENSYVTAVVLTGDLFDKALIDIHNSYRVVISRKKPTLVPKG
jgi:hypothetical protein